MKSSTTSLVSLNYPYEQFYIWDFHTCSSKIFIKKYNLCYQTNFYVIGTFYYKFFVLLLISSNQNIVYKIEILKLIKEVD